MNSISWKAKARLFFFLFLQLTTMKKIFYCASCAPSKGLRFTAALDKPTGKFGGGEGGGK